MLSKPSKGRYLELKRASFASQKGVNCKPIYALFVCCLRILFTITHIFTGAIESLKGRRMRKSIILLFPYLNQIQLLFLGLRWLSFSLLTSNLLSCLLVTLSTKETFFCYSVFIFRPSFVSLLLCLYLSCLNLTLSQSDLVILSTAIVVIIIMNYELWILH